MDDVTAPRKKAWEDRNREKVRAKNIAWNKANPEAMRAAAARYEKAHPEKVRARKDAWNRANPEKARERARAWRLANPEWARENNRKYRENSFSKIRAYQIMRAAACRRAQPEWANQFFIDEIYRLARLRTKLTGIAWHVDHIVPIKSALVCGLHVEHNLQVIPGRDNQRKNNRHWPDMPE